MADVMDDSVLHSLENLWAVDADHRTSEWEHDLLRLLPKIKVSILAAEPQVGPDGWPYLFLAIDEESDEPILNVLEWLSTRGIGAAINPQKETPDMVLSFGMIWNFRERGRFVEDQKESISTGEIQLESGQTVRVGKPTETIMPNYVRSIVKQFLLDQGVMAPKVAMISFDHKNYDLCFSLESLKAPPQHEHQGIVEALSWFFPTHYSISLLSEKKIEGFNAL